MGLIHLTPLHGPEMSEDSAAIPRIGIVKGQGSYYKIDQNRKDKFVMMRSEVARVAGRNTRWPMTGDFTKSAL